MRYKLHNTDNYEGTLGNNEVRDSYYKEAQAVIDSAKPFKEYKPELSSFRRNEAGGENADKVSYNCPRITSLLTEADLQEIERERKRRSEATVDMEFIDVEVGYFESQSFESFDVEEDTISYDFDLRVEDIN